MQNPISRTAISKPTLKQTANRNSAMRSTLAAVVEAADGKMEICSLMAERITPSPLPLGEG